MRIFTSAPLFIFVRGYPGSGKSQFSLQLSKLLNCSIIEPDALLGKMENINRVAKVSAYKSNYCTAIQQLKTNRSVIWAQPWCKVENLFMVINDLRLLSPEYVFVVIELFVSRDEVMRRLGRRKYQETAVFLNYYDEKYMEMDSKTLNTLGVFYIRIPGDIPFVGQIEIFKRNLILN